MRVKTELKWDGDKVKILGKKVVNKSAFETGLIVEGQAKLLAPVAHGRLAASITTQSLTQSSGGGEDVISKPNKIGVVLVGTAVEYAPYVEFGTMAHTITAKGKGLSDGKSFFGKTVKHPGTAAQPFLRPAAGLSVGRILPLVRKLSKMIFGEYLR